MKDIIGDATGAQPGTYYIIVKGTTEASLNIAITEKDVSGTFEDEDPENFVSRTLKAGVAVADRLAKSDSQRFYNFKINLKENVDLITINIIPKRGNFMVSVRNDDQKPDPTQGFWTASDNMLIITKDDALFKEDAEYMIAVFPDIADKDLDAFIEGKAPPYEYEIKFSYSDKHNKLTPGVPETGILHDHKKCFTLEILQNYSDIVITKTLASREVDFYGSIGSINREPNAQQSDYEMSSGESALYIDDLQEKC